MSLENRIAAVEAEWVSLKRRNRAIATIALLAALRPGFAGVHQRPRQGHPG